jgi:hypothetical protein
MLRWFSNVPDMSKSKRRFAPQMSHKQVAAIIKFYDAQQDQEVLEEVEKGISIFAKKQMQPPRRRERRGRMRKTR